ncbi:MAG: TolC family protein [Aquabacterium sp.]
MFAPLHRLTLVLAAPCTALLLGGCASLKPEPLTQAEIRQTTAADRQQMQQGIEPLQGPLTLDEAIARAIKYNLGRRVQMMAEALAKSQLDVGQYDMLPKLVASAGYRDRSKDLITRSTDSVTGQPSLANPFISSDRTATTTELSFTWSLLDFGQSYYASRQQADRVLVAGEQRRKAMHTLIQDVRTAFWRTAGAQKLRDSVRATITDSEEALGDARKASGERVRSPLEPLRFQRQLLENLRLLETIEQELSTAQIELAALTNLPLGQAIAVTEPSEQAGRELLGLSVEQMEERAIANNADLRTSLYNARIARLETRRAMLKMFPGLSFSYSLNGSNDSYLINQHWTEAGAQVSLNLLGLLSAPAQMRMADAGVALAEQERMATQMALLTQVHVARLQFGNAVKQFERADAIWQVDKDIASQVTMREQAQTQSKLDRVANNTAAIVSQLRRYQALAQMQTAAGKLQATLGLEPTVPDDRKLSLQEMTRQVSMALNPPAEAPAETAQPLQAASLSAR